MMPKLGLALLAQVIAFVLVMGMAWIAPNWIAPPYEPHWFVLGQALLAMGVTRVMRLEVWWLWIAFILPWAGWMAWNWQLNPWVALGVFVGVVLVFANAFSDRVPLYLTNTTTHKALKVLLKEKFAPYQSIRFADLGCGLGGNVFFMAKQPKVAVSVGVETAPIPYVLAWLRWQLARLTQKPRHDSTQDKTQFRPDKIQILPQDLWKHSLSEYDLVYVFLSTEPMPELWQKAVNEMAASAWLVSNSFAVPDVTPTDIWQLNDRRQTILYLYHMAQFSPAGQKTGSLNSEN